MPVAAAAAALMRPAIFFLWTPQAQDLHKQLQYITFVLSVSKRLEGWLLLQH
jgi:hypothetical protein